MRPRCQHCHKNLQTKPRGLCFSCHRNLAIRNQYPTSGSKFARRGVPDRHGKTNLPAKPTQAPAGSPEKVKVLEQRARIGVSLWHPEDSDQLDLAALASQHGNPRKGRHKKGTYARATY